ncbi:Pre-mRNA-splicing factor cwc2 [Penicillium verhagenii]|uniref:Pre-mRNA-splicing factor cwc2 n=1 Tax=Penicillium verhagenii TaxID=1562060 RepID=UPI002544DBD0|nr:Pre-mRNA-splicing factor cwc2 [Penicillium verhagenii]KAJ5921243.1 Pre-mRNA-splicing factor cwc2 [Penicillium verhagenii]
MAESPVAEPAVGQEVALVSEEQAEEQQQLEPVKKTKKIIRKKRRPARVQVDPSEIKSEQPPQTGDLFNIWYSKWSGGDREDRFGLNTPAPTRCDPVKDSGYTKADRVNGSYFCTVNIFIDYRNFMTSSILTWIVSAAISIQITEMIWAVLDLFTDKIAPFTSDGSMSQYVYLAFICWKTQEANMYILIKDAIEEAVARHFAPWGAVQRMRVLSGRGVAFVTYMNEANAQFAKEAMSHQALDHNEILNVRWATVDPNPAAQKREQRQLEEQAAEAVRRALPAAYVAELEGRDPEAKKRRKIEGTFGLEGYDVPDDVWRARTRQLESAPAPAQLEAPEQQLMIEEPTYAQPEPEPEAQNGFFSSATVAALRGLAGGNVTTQATSKPSGGPLVAYGSDDESD